MAALTVEKKAMDLHSIISKIKRVFFVNTPNSDLSKLAGFDIELPVIEDGVNIDMGTPEEETTKLIDGTNWVMSVTKGDTDISLQIASVHEVISELFSKKVGEQITMANGFGDGSETYKGQGYSGEVKKSVGGLFFRSEDNEASMWLPNVEMTGTLKADGSKPAYYEVKVNPLPNGDGMVYALLERAQ